MKLRPISVEILRDHNTPDVAVELAVRALRSLDPILDNGLSIVDSGRIEPVSVPGSTIVDTDNIPRLDIRADFGIIMTHNELTVRPEKSKKIIRENTILAGMAYSRGKNRPYGIIDANQSGVPEHIVTHEFGHLLRIKHGGEYYDGESHCTIDECNMYPVSSGHNGAFCQECAHHTASNFHSLRRKKSSLFGRYLFY
ncbi:hypothetical protein KC953_01730 [Candidatus Saccharibacteria bacterium]|nr:hypothetical protein [Candidatus Saccharibacteria bacterium]